MVELGSDDTSLTISFLSDDELVLTGRLDRGKLVDIVVKGRLCFSSSDFITPSVLFRLMMLDSKELFVLEPLLIDIFVIAESAAGDVAEITDDVILGVATVVAIVVRRLKAC